MMRRWLSPWWRAGQCCCPCFAAQQRRMSAWKQRRSGEVTVECADRPQTLSVGQLARFADGSATARDGDTSVLVTVVSRPRGGPSPGFLPLTVDYRQKAAAAGRIPTNFLRRELGPSEQEILTSRMIDRSLRARFAPGYSSDTQISCNLLAVDGDRLPDVLCVNAASAALACSDIPWGDPVGAVRIGWCNGEPVVNPGRRDLAESKLNLVVTAGLERTVVMLEASADNLLQNDFQHAISVGVKEAGLIADAISQLQKEYGTPKRSLATPEDIHDLVDALRTLSEARLRIILTDASHDKISRDEAVTAVRQEVIETLKAEIPAERHPHLNEAFNNLFRNIFRQLTLDNETRCDGRRRDQLRDITCQVDLFKPLHGSALFQRGQTQVMCTLALDSPESVLKSDLMAVITQGVKPKNFMLHYEFPPYATNEIGRLSAGRRELGHGALAERALRAVVPESFPFTLRLTAEVLESNGSSSMASVCAGSLALMDAGVPVSSAVAGIAVGMVSTPNPEKPSQPGDYKLLTDILGIEDYCGDMDFKLACTRRGVTALQADFKLSGVPVPIVMEAVQVGRDGIKQIFEHMDLAIRQPRPHRKANWPVMRTLDVPPHKRARLLGPGGHNLKRLMAETGVQVTAVDDGSFSVFAPNPAAMDEAQSRLEAVLASDPEPQFEFGAVYAAKVVELRESGVMVQLHPAAAPVLVHNSQLDSRPVRHPSALGIQEGDELQVKYFGRDPVSGHVRLSRKAVIGPASGRVQNLMPTNNIG